MEGSMGYEKATFFNTGNTWHAVQWCIWGNRTGGGFG